MERGVIRGRSVKHTEIALFVFAFQLFEFVEYGHWMGQPRQPSLIFHISALSAKKSPAKRGRGTSELATSTQESSSDGGVYAQAYNHVVWPAQREEKEKGRR